MAVETAQPWPEAILVFVLRVLAPECVGVSGGCGGARKQVVYPQVVHTKGHDLALRTLNPQARSKCTSPMLL